MHDVATERTARSWPRRSLAALAVGLATIAVASLANWAGPPWLDLERRQKLLVSLRHAIERDGLALEELRGGWRYRVIAQGKEALAVLEADEAAADAKDHWWLRDAVCRSPDGGTVVVYGHDPDGHDMDFQAWGPSASRHLESVQTLLKSHHP